MCFIFFFIFSCTEIKCNCYLRNEKGDRHKIPERFVRPLHAIGFSIGDKEIQKNDILLPTSFCMFDNQNNRLMLEDTCKNAHSNVLYPIPVQTIRNLDKVQQLPLTMNAIKTDAKKDGWKGFELKNTGHQCLLLQNMFLAREKTNFKQQIPERPMNPGDIMRFVFAQNNNNDHNLNSSNPDDILINERDFGKLDFPDKLLLIDKDGHFKVLHDGCHLQNMPSSCKVM